MTAVKFLVISKRRGHQNNYNYIHDKYLRLLKSNVLVKLLYHEIALIFLNNNLSDDSEAIYVYYLKVLIMSNEFCYSNFAVFLPYYFKDCFVRLFC